MDTKEHLMKHQNLFLRYIRFSVLVGCYLLAANCGSARAADVAPAQAPVEFAEPASAPAEPLCLWYRTPAESWVQALPLGSGRLGAMVFGGVDKEHLQLNEDTLYAGGPYDPTNPTALAALPQARQLIFDGKYREADRLIGQKMMAKPLRQMPYQTAGDFWLAFPPLTRVEQYRRELNLDTAISRVTYRADGVVYMREVFASPVDQVIVVRLTADKPGSISFAATMSSPQKTTVSTEVTGALVMSGVNGSAQGINGALKYQVRAQIKTRGGAVEAGSDQLSVKGADEAVILLAAATGYKSYKDVSGDPAVIVRKTLDKATSRTFAQLEKSHVTEHQRIFRRVSLDLGRTEAASQPTDARIAAYGNGQDPQLAELYFQYGRYLMLSCSRPGGQPANLQGLWNDSMSPPWDSKYTININTEMNYWPVDSCNMGECVEPLERMVLELMENGARTARVHYGAPGWVVHHNTDLWRVGAPIDGPAYGMWPMGGAWLLQNLWEHYQFTGDEKFLARIYPAMKGSAEFYLSALVEEPTHKWLVTCPSMSPENQHPFGASVCAGPTMDMEILRDLFSNCIRASEILKKDADQRPLWQSTRARLAPLQIGKQGQLQEWLEDWDAKAPEQKHRHVSHLYAMFPGAQITPRATPALAAAVDKTLETRGDLSTGWSLAWKFNLRARLGQGDHACKLLGMLLTPERTYPNMFDACPPFQIDGNFGASSAMAEMLLQSHQRADEESANAFELELLPALPKAWAEGSIKGLRARGGFEVDMAWKEGRLTRTVVRSLQGNPCKIRLGDKVIDLKTRRGNIYNLNGALQPASGSRSDRR